MIHHKAICPKCKATVACTGVRVTLSQHYLYDDGKPCPGSNLDLNPRAEETYTTRVPGFRERFPTLADYAATCRPLWVAITEDDRKEK